MVWSTGPRDGPSAVAHRMLEAAYEALSPFATGAEVANLKRLSDEVARLRRKTEAP